MSNSVTLSPRSASPRTKPASVLPQWALELMRPVLGFIGRAFWKLKHSGIENIPREGGLVIAANHQTYLDPFLISIPIKRPLRFLAWNEVFGWPLVGKVLGFLGAWPLQLEGSDPAAIRRSLQWLREGGAVMIFPEGGRGKPDGSMARFKGGAVRIALEAGVPVLPVTIRGANHIWPVGRRFPGLGKIEIIYHPIYRVGQNPDEETRDCARRESEQLAEIIGADL